MAMESQSHLWGCHLLRNRGVKAFLSSPLPVAVSVFLFLRNREYCCAMGIAAIPGTAKFIPRQISFIAIQN